MDKADFYREARKDLSGPLAGVRVVDFTTSWAGPMCACILADLGAEVIKVEAPGGEVSRRLPPFLTGKPAKVSFANATVNRNKRNLTLDLGRPEGREIFLKLAASADVVVQNFRPGTVDKWGIGYADVRRVKPDIVYVSITGFGQFGPTHDRVCYDPLAQAAGGFVSLNGTADGPPVKAATYLCDDLAGLHGAIGALAALRHRDQTGEGQHVDVALLDALLFQSNGYPTIAAMGLPLQRWGNEFPISAPSNVYDCRDGKVMAGVLLDTHWRRLAHILGRPELADHPDFATLPARLAHRPPCNALMREWMAVHTVSEVIAIFEREGIPAAPVNTYAQAVKDPQVVARDMMQPTLQEDGSTVPITGPVAKFSRTPTRVRHGAPALGADNDEILGDLGFDAAARARLRERGII